jgi:hypothetical protein
MAAQDEGHIPFDKLPKRELRDWIEDWIDLPTTATIQPPGADGGGTTIVTNTFGEDEFWGGVQVPKWRANGTADTAFTAAEVRFMRFSLTEDETVTGFDWVSDGGIAVGDTFDGGLYNAAGTVLLASSGVIAPANSVDRPGAFAMPFTGNVDLDAGTHYTLALVQIGAAGAGNTYVANNISTMQNKMFGNTFATWVQGTVSNGVPYAALPADLSAGTAKAACGACGPFAILTVA